MSRSTRFSGWMLAWSLTANLTAQNYYLADWFQRSDRAKATQPTWITPLVTVTPRLEQEFRADFLVLQTARGDLVNWGGGKGVEVIPSGRVQVSIGIPPYVWHGSPSSRDGFGDFALGGKYRLLAASEERAITFLRHPSV